MDHHIRCEMLIFYHSRLRSFNKNNNALTLSLFCFTPVSAFFLKPSKGVYCQYDRLKDVYCQYDRLKDVYCQYDRLKGLYCQYDRLKDVYCQYDRLKGLYCQYDRLKGLYCQYDRLKVAQAPPGCRSGGDVNTKGSLTFPSSKNNTW